MIILITLFAFIIIILSFDVMFSGGFKRKHEIDGISDIAQKSREYNVVLPTPIQKAINSFDGTRLKGYIFNSVKKSDYLVILIHGYGLSHKEMLYFADLYYNRYGFNVMTPDLRGHGESGGNYICFGVKDREDIYCWIEYAKQMYGDKVKIILHGVSMGAATALMTGAYNDRNVKGIIADCPYASGEQMVKNEIRSKYNLGVGVIYLILKICVKIKCGYSIKDSNVIDYVGEINCPVLYIHGEKDNFVTPSDSYLLFEKTNCEKDLFIADDAGHAESIIIQNEKYINKINEFINGISKGQTA